MKTWTAAAALLAMMAPALLDATLGSPAWAQSPEPANAQIKGVYDDLDRFEQQAAGANASGANRILRLLKVTEGRLQGASDQDHASWQAAAQRLATLQQQLEDTAAGRPPAAAAPAQAASPTAPAVDTPAVEAAPSIEAAPALDSGSPEVAAAAAEIARLSAQVDTMAPGDKATGQQYLNELKAIGDRLRGVADKDAAWSETATSFNALQQRVVATANAAPAPGPATGAAPAAQGTAAADPNVERVLRELGFNDRNIQQMRGASVRMEERILADMTRIRDLLDQSPGREHPTWQEADIEWQRQMDLLAQKRLDAIRQQLDSLGEQIAGLDDVSLVSDQTVAQVRGHLETLAGEMAVYDSYASRDGYAETWNAHTRTAALLQERVAAAEATEKSFGDIPATVAAIEQRFRETPVPQALREFHSKEAVVTYAESMKKAYADSVQAARYLQQVDGRTGQVDKQTIQRLLHWADHDRMRQIDESLRETRNHLDGHWAQYQGVIDFRASDDPADPNHRANRFLLQGRFEENVTQLKEGLQFVSVAEAYERALGAEDDGTRSQQQAALQGALGKYEADFQLALSTMRMTPGTGDSELERIAADTLQNPNYGVNLPWKRLEVGKKAHREEARSEISGNSLITNLYKWDEFQVRTAEQVDGKWYVFINDLKYFYSGASTTPLDRWLVADRWQGEQILEENIGK